MPWLCFGGLGSPFVDDFTGRLGCALERQTFSLIKQSEREASSLKPAVNYCLCNSVESASLRLKH